MTFRVCGGALGRVGEVWVEAVCRLRGYGSRYRDAIGVILTLITSFVICIFL